MDIQNNVIGNVNVEVKAGLSVDNKTARICMDLLSIHFKNLGYKGVVLGFSDGNGVGVCPLKTEEDVYRSMNANIKRRNPEDED